METLTDDGRKEPKHVGGLLYCCVYFCIELLCSCQNKHYKQDKRYMYHVTLRRFHTTVVAVEKQYVVHNLRRCL